MKGVLSALTRWGTFIALTRVPHRRPEVASAVQRQREGVRKATQAALLDLDFQLRAAARARS